MTHFKSETQSRGGCPADWVWIVPPISGSVTPVFHQEMLLYHLSPSYQYQEDPWKHHSFKDAVAQGRQRQLLPFKKVAFMVQKMMKIFGKIYQKRVKATILYASETGRSKNYASVVNDVFGRVFATKVMCMEDYDRANLEQEQMLLIVTSTFGSGDPPANGEMFGRYLLDLRNGSSAHGLAAAPTPRSHRMSTVVAPTREHLQQGGSPGRNSIGPLTQVKYCVFGLGSRAYPNFCTFAHTCDNLLSDLGAEKILACGEGDELCGQEESFQAWLKQCYQEACAAYSLEQHLDDSDLEGYKTGYSSEKFRVMKYDNARPIRDECIGLRAVHSKDVYPAVLKSRVKLQPSHSDRSTIMAVLGMSGSRRLNYEPGDHVAIFPQNNHKVVTTLIDRLNPSISPDQPIFIESRRVSTSGDSWVEDRRMPVPVTLREALTYYLDITNPPSAQFLKLLAKQATRLADQENLNELAKGGDTYEDWKYERFPSFCDVMDQFPSLKVDVTLLLQQLPLLQCRYYSISSSPKLHPDEVHVTVAVVSFRKRNGMGPRHNGVCSTWLNKVDLGEVIPCFIRKAHAFRMPKDPRVPIIMVGPGTGIAPFRSFWQDRIYVKNEALKIQLSMPSNLPTKPVQRKIQKAGRTRRVTEYIAPNRDLLNTSRGSIDITNKSLHVFSTPPLVLDEDEVDGGNLKMCRSISDVDDVSREEIARVLANRQKEWGTLSLYFGCRRSDLDHIYKDELKKAQVTGGLDNVYVSLSREPGQGKKYVQHLLKENADAVVHQLIEERGHFYVCGDISMAADVCRTLQSIFESNAAMSADQARKLIESMKDTGFYHEDIFGVTFKHQEVTTRVRTAAKKAWRIIVNTGDSLMLSSPMTPQVRMPSPLPGAMPRHPLDIQFSSSTLPLKRSGVMRKQPTVTVLNTQKLTPTEQFEKMLHSRTSAPQLAPPKFNIPHRADSPVMGGNPILEPVVEVTSPQSSDTSEKKKEESTESSSSETVVRRHQSDESRQSRRIKTISSVETVV
uniref:nitric-oxide synthase (NADPH) n=1 Tax=Halichondria panicea TaxID=6063 RepID=A0A6C0SLC8_HALPA|nr:nitric-oxide synthase [Halichondria panicea]